MNGNDETVTILRDIWNEMKTLNGRVHATNERLDQTNSRLEQLWTRVDAGFARMEAGFALVDRRFDHLLLGEHGHEHKELRERVARLEQRVGILPVRTP